MHSLKGKNIIVGVCGAIAAYKACALVRSLVKLEANVKCILTKNAQQFVTPLTFQTLSKNKVYTQMFEVLNEVEIEHIALANWADLFVIAPATADFIARLAAGRADDLLSCAVLASKAKILICPSMNANMLHHKATQKNIETLTSYDYKFVNPAYGELACGIIADGRLEEISKITQEIEKAL
jgi:phosphopantothenoylcysteine decarboxylase/phosphopantothenate--cysteine ligase